MEMIPQPQNDLQNEQTAAAYEANRNAIDTFLDQFAHSPNSQQAYRNSLKRIAALYGVHGEHSEYEVPLIFTGYKKAVEIRKKLIESGQYSDGTINHTLTTLRGIADVLFRNGEIDADQRERIKDVKSVKTNSAGKGYNFIARDEIKAIYAYLEGKTANSAIRNTAMIAVLQHGLRVSELINLTMDNYNPQNATLTFEGKGNKTRTVPLKPFAVHFLNTWFDIRGNTTGAIFCLLEKLTGVPLPSFHIKRGTVNNIIDDITQAIELPHIAPHDFRRFFVSALLESGYDYGEIQVMTGHSDIRTVARYDKRKEKAIFEKFQDDDEF